MQQEKKSKVDSLIQQLALQACRNTTIGSSLDRGVSGGEVSLNQLTVDNDKWSVCAIHIRLYCFAIKHCRFVWCDCCKMA